jgi:hypothetical protein
MQKIQGALAKILPSLGQSEKNKKKINHFRWKKMCAVLVYTCCDKVDAGPWNLHALLLDPGHLLGVHLPRDVVVADKDYLLVVSSPF